MKLFKISNEFVEASLYQFVKTEKNCCDSENYWIHGTVWNNGVKYCGNMNKGRSTSWDIYQNSCTDNSFMIFCEYVNAQAE